MKIHRKYECNNNSVLPPYFDLFKFVILEGSECLIFFSLIRPINEPARLNKRLHFRTLDQLQTFFYFGLLEKKPEDFYVLNIKYDYSSKLKKLFYSISEIFSIWSGSRGSFVCFEFSVLSDSNLAISLDLSFTLLIPKWVSLQMPVEEVPRPPEVDKGTLIFLVGVLIAMGYGIHV